MSASPAAGYACAAPGWPPSICPTAPSSRWRRPRRRCSVLPDRRERGRLQELVGDRGDDCAILLGFGALLQPFRVGGEGVPLGFAFGERSEEHTSELQSLMRISYAVFCLKKKRQRHQTEYKRRTNTIPRDRRNNHSNEKEKTQ